MKKNKLKITRPDFLLDLMGGDVSVLTTGSMKLCMKDTTPLCYCVYTVLMEADIDRSDILHMNNDGESIGIKFHSKGEAKDVKERCGTKPVRYGSTRYNVRIKHRDQYLIFDIDPVEEKDNDD